MEDCIFDMCVCKESHTLYYWVCTNVQNSYITLVGMVSAENLLSYMIVVAPNVYINMRNTKVVFTSIYHPLLDNISSGVCCLCISAIMITP